MGSMRPRDMPRDLWNLSTPASGDMEPMGVEAPTDVEGLRDVEALREENRQLKELVIQLSKIVVRNVAERK